MILEKKFDFWYIESTGGDPYFTIPNFDPESNRGEIFVKIAITSTNRAMLEIFFTSDNKGFDSDHSISKNIEKGYNEIIVKITETSPIKALRLDPGNLAGIYLLHKFEVRKKKRQ